MRFAFGDCVLDSQRHVLERDGIPVQIEPKAFDLLVFLLQRRDRVVSKAELLEAVWDGRSVSDAALTTTVRTVRKAVDQDGAPSVIKTMPRIGYHFLGQVDILPDGEVLAASLHQPTRSNAPRPASSRIDGLPLKPSIAVVPFDCMTTEADDVPFAHGLTEDLITALSQFKELSVAGRNSSFAVHGHGLTTPELGERLGVRFILEGSIRRAGGRVRITAQMIEAATDQHVWARTYDRESLDIFEVQDEVTRSIACVILSSIVVTEQRRIESLPTEQLNPWECYHRAYELAESRDMDSKREALRIWERALELDPNFVEGAALLVRATSIYCALSGPTDERSALIERATEVAERALHLDPHHDLLWAACVNLHAHVGATNKAMNAARKALHLNPQGQHSLYANGLASLINGDHAKAAEYYKSVLSMGQDITIRHPAMSICAVAVVNLGRFEEAIELCHAAQHEPGADFRAFIAEISALGHLARLDEAASVIDRAQELQPGLGFAFLEHCHPFDANQSATPLYEGLRKARLPD